MDSIELAREYVATHGVDWKGLAIVLTILLVSQIVLVFLVTGKEKEKNNGQ